nr:hypothetical protein [Tanacetum cinerariifolium]
MPSFPSPKPNVSCFDDLEFFKDFENEFLAIVYNDALTSKSDHLTESTLSPQHIDKFDLKDETSLSEYDEVEQNILYFNDLFPFNIIYLDDLKSGKLVSKNGYGVLGKDIYDIWLFHLEIRGTGTLGLRDIADFKKRLGKIYRGEVHGVHVFDFGGLTGIIHEGLRGRTLMEYKDAQGQSVFTSRAWMRLFEIRVSVGGARRRMRWRHFILALGLHTTEEMETTGFGLYWVESGRQISEKGDLSAFWREISFEGDFLYTPFLYSYQGSNVEIMPQAHRLEEEEGYDIWESIYVKLDDTWAWVAPGPQRQQVAAAGALEAAEDALVADEGA